MCLWANFLMSLSLCYLVRKLGMIPAPCDGVGWAQCIYLGTSWTQFYNLPSQTSSCQIGRSLVTQETWDPVLAFIDLEEFSLPSMILGAHCQEDETDLGNKMTQFSTRAAYCASLAKPLMFSVSSESWTWLFLGLLSSFQQSINQSCAWVPAGKTLRLSL